MIYKIAHILIRKFPWLWVFVEMFNSSLFFLKYGRKINAIEDGVLNAYGLENGMKIVPMKKVDANLLADFFAKQPENAYTYFRPHEFDAKSIKKLQSNKSYLAYILLEDSSRSNIKVIGYCFIRGFFHGKGFRGRMIGIDYRGRGYGSMMNRMMNDIGFGIGLRLFETVSKDNLPSYQATMSTSKVKVIEEMENNELYLEILKD